jgi:predicted RNase H-like HicB family nuclease
MKTLEQAVDNLSETIKEASEMIISLREENKKQKVALDYVKQWLNENIDEGSPDGVQYDSANLLQNLKELLGE